MPDPEQLGPYRIVEPLGSGAMGTVYRAEHAELGTPAAVKVLTAGADDPRLLARFQRESQAAARLAGHPGIAGVHDAGLQDGVPWMAMELIDGRPLDGAIREERFGPEQTAAVGEALAQALAHAHAAGLLHRDIKPANVLLRRDGTPALADFGLARTTALDAELTRLTRSGEIVGTPAYMPPEQVRGEPVDGRADLYALGATLYECLAGTPPFAEPSLHGTLRAVLHDPPASLRSLVPGVPRDLETIVLRCLAKDPAERFGSAGELGAELARFRRGEPIASRRPSPAARFGRGLLRHRMAVAALCLVAAGAGGAAWWFTRTSGTTAEREQAIRNEQSSVDLAGRASAACAAWQAMVQQAGPALGRLQDAENGTPGIDRAGEQAAVEAIAKAVAAKWPDAGAPAAFGAAARFYGGDPDALRGIDLKGTPDPFPALMATKLLLDRYALALRLPGVTSTSTGVSIEDYQESPMQVELRIGAGKALALVRNHPLWPHCHAVADWARYVEGAVALTTGDYAGVDAALEPLADDPALGPGARMILGAACYLRRDLTGAIAHWRRPMARGWTPPHQNAAVAHLALANAATAGGPGDADALYDRCRELATLVLERGVPPSSLPPLLQLRAAACRGMASRAQRRGDDPFGLLDRSRADLDRALAATPDSASILASRGSMLLARGQMEVLLRRDPSASLNQAVADLDRAVELRPDMLSGLLHAGTARMRRARLVANRGQDPRPDLDRGEALLTRAMELAPGKAEAPSMRGMLRLARVQLRAYTGLPRTHVEAALDDLERAVRLAPQAMLAMQQRAIAKFRLAELAMARREPDNVQRHLADAAADLETATTNEPDMPEHWVWMAQVRMATAQLLARRRADPKPQIRLALEAFDRVVKLNPNRPVGWFGRAQVRENLGDLDGARSDLAELLRRFPDHQMGKQMLRRLARGE